MPTPDERAGRAGPPRARGRRYLAFLGDARAAQERAGPDPGVERDRRTPPALVLAGGPGWDDEVDGRRRRCPRPHRACSGRATCRSTTCPASSAGPSSSPTRATARASACRCSRRWPAAPGADDAACSRCRRSAATRSPTPARTPTSIAAALRALLDDPDRRAALRRRRGWTTGRARSPGGQRPGPPGGATPAAAARVSGSAAGRRRDVLARRGARRVPRQPARGHGPAARGRARRQRLRPTAPRSGGGRAPATSGCCRTGGNVGYGAAANAALADVARGVGRWSPTPTSGSRPARSTSCSPPPTAGPAAATLGPAIRTPEGELYPSARDLPVAVDRHRARRCSAGCGRPTRGRARYRREREDPRERTGRLAVRLLPPGRAARRSTRSAASTRPTSCTSRTSTSPSGWAGAAGCTSTCPRRSSSTRAGTPRRGEPRRMLRVHHTSALRYLSAQYPAPAARAAARALRAGLGGRMLLSYVSGRVGAGRALQRHGGGPAPAADAGRAGDEERKLHVRHAVIMAGGSGTRLWPLSRAARPKQLLDVVADAGRRGAQPAGRGVRPGWSRCCPPSGSGCAPPRATPTRCARPCRGCAPTGWCSSRRPATPPTPSGSAAALVADVDPDAELAVVSADHVIRPGRAVRRRAAHRLRRAGRAAAARWSPSASRRPRRPPASATCSAARPRSVPGAAEAASFREKPDRATAEAYLASGEYLWNSGMFVWRAPHGARRAGRAPARDRRRAATDRRRTRRAGRGTPSSPRSSRPCRRSASTTPSWSRRPPSPAGCSSSTSTSTGSTSARGRRWRTRSPSTPTATPVSGLAGAARRAGNVVLSDDPGPPRRPGRRARQRRGAHRRRHDGLPGRRRRAGQGPARRGRPPGTARGTAERLASLRA